VENWHFQKYSKECFTEFVGLSKKYIYFTVIKIKFPYIKLNIYMLIVMKMPPCEKVNGLYLKDYFLFQGELFTGLSS